MQTSFNFEAPAVGKQFIGREIDVSKMVNLLNGGESVALYDEPGTGKMSLIRNCLTKMRMDGEDIRVAQVDLSRARTGQDMLLEFASGVSAAFASLGEQCAAAVSRQFEGSSVEFDQEAYRRSEPAFSMGALMFDERDAAKVFRLPSALSSAGSQTLNTADSPAPVSPASGPAALPALTIVLVTQFQNILFAGEERMLLRQLELANKERGPRCAFIFTGSHLNGMREIFDVRRLFWKEAERFEMSVIDESRITDYVYRSFQQQGKVLEKDIIAASVRILRCNMRYVNQLFSIADSSSFGYVNRNDISGALSRLVSIHRPRFFAQVCSLTDFQLSLLRAITAGELRLSSTPVVRRYHLNSSANVKRLKDALVKKEMVWFDGKDEPHVMDPLFEYWLYTEYFA